MNFVQEYIFCFVLHFLTDMSVRASVLLPSCLGELYMCTWAHEKHIQWPQEPRIQVQGRSTCAQDADVFPRRDSQLKDKNGFWLGSGVWKPCVKLSFFYMYWYLCELTVTYKYDQPVLRHWHSNKRQSGLWANVFIDCRKYEPGQ